MPLEARSWWRVPEARAAAAVDAPATRAGALPFRVLVVFTVFNLLAPQQFVPGLDRLRPALLLALLAICSYVVDRMQHRLPISVSTRETRLVLGLVVWIVVTIPLSMWPLGSLAYLLGTFLKVLLVFLLLANTVTDTRRLTTLYWTFSLASVPIALTAIVHYATGRFIDPLETGAVERIVGYTGPLTTNPNDTALMLNVILPFTLALAVAARRTWPRLLLGAVAALGALGVVCTLSRGGFLTLLAIGGAFLWMRMARRPLGLRVAAVGAAVLVLVLLLPMMPSSIVDRMSTIADFSGDTTGSASERVSDMLAASRYVALHPLFGAGLGMSTLALNEARGAAWRLVHNVYLEVGVELGLVGLVLFVALLLSCLRATRARPGRSPALASLVAGLRLALIGFAVAGMFHPVAYDFYFYYLAALAVAVRHMGARARTAAVSDPARPRAVDDPPVLDPARAVRA
jgi:probable O-glycosylation ligase (exosortase A-associated)